MAALSLSDIQSEALAAGFSLAGVREPARPVHYPAFETWLDKGLQAGMEWIARPYSRSLRADPARLLPGCRSIVSLGLLYPSSAMVPPHPGFGRVAAYAWVKDYHRTLTAALKALARRVADMAGRPPHFRVYVDSSPLLERDLAAMSGLGWIGKNTCLISPRLGSFMFLAEILTDLELPRSEPFQADRCGTCRRCIEACPTGCIREDRLIDSNRCISYLTIEHNGVIPSGLRARMGDWVFGCDICQIVCPWNRKPAPQPTSPILERRLDPGRIDLFSDLGLTDAEFARRYADLPLKRAGWENYLRNVLVAAGNSHQEQFIPPLSRILIDQPSALLRVHAAWALGQFPQSPTRFTLEKALKTEPDSQVRAEIKAALNQ